MDLGYAAHGVRDGVRARIRDRASRARPRGNWWAEGFGFVPEDAAPGSLSGSTKLMLLGAVPPEVDMAMALRDAAFLVRRLAWWSLRYNVRWVVSMGGAKVGRIRFGLPSLSLLTRLAQLAFIARFMASTPLLFPLRRYALREYANRWDGGP